MVNKTKGTNNTPTVSFTFKGIAYTYPANATVSPTAKAKALNSGNNPKALAYNGGTIGNIGASAIYGAGILKSASYTFNNVKINLPLTKGDLAYFIGNGLLKVSS